MMRILLSLLRYLAVGTGVVVATVYLVWAVDSRTMPPLKDEHRVQFIEEFRAKQESDTDWAGYLALEERLAVETREKIGLRDSISDVLDRYGRGSVSNPNEYSPNWNRSYTLPAEAPRGTAVLVHGLTDSPYSMRATAQLMQELGLSAYAPRMPGHGFAVGDLRHATWEDWMAAVRIAMRAADAKKKIGQPLIMVGYSNGGLLAVRYALDCRDDDTMPCPDGIVLLSPAIDVTLLARFAQWHRGLSWMGYFERFQWGSILPEVDPYKFTSFPNDPALEIHRAARAVGEDMAGRPGELPPMLAFQSAVDDTVSTLAVVNLFRRLPPNGSELVIYDVNRSNLTASLMTQPPPDLLQMITQELPLPFAVTVVTNEGPQSLALRAVRFDGRRGASTERSLDMHWQNTIFSLSHIAVPFEPSDPIYGPTRVPGYPNFGGAAPRGERRVLSLDPNYFARLRYNPFFSFQRDTTVQWLERWLEPQEASSEPDE
jgi:alpha-beta hydrolase superfamily lysophospholipase